MLHVTANPNHVVYGITLQKPNLPIVNVGHREHPSYLPAEVCMVLPGQPARRDLDRAQTTAMQEFAVRLPASNARSITEVGTRVLNFKNNPYLVCCASFFNHMSSPLTLIGRLWLEYQLEVDFCSRKTSPQLRSPVQRIFRATNSGKLELGSRQQASHIRRWSQAARLGLSVDTITRGSGSLE
jgi:hypothetical protein